MLNIEKIAKAVESLGGVGVAPLHETSTPAVIFTTEDGKAYRVDFLDAPDDETSTKVAKAIEDAAGVKVDWYGPTRAKPERDKAIQVEMVAATAAAAEAAKSDPPPVVQG